MGRQNVSILSIYSPTQFPGCKLHTKRRRTKFSQLLRNKLTDIVQREGRQFASRETILFRNCSYENKKHSLQLVPSLTTVFDHLRKDKLFFRQKYSWVLMYELCCLYSDHSTLYFSLISAFLHTVLYFI